MATEKDDFELQKHNRSVSAPSTMKIMDHHLNHGRSATADCSHNELSRSLTEKSIPNYLKPTISSSHDTNCSYIRHNRQQTSKASPTDSSAGKRLSSRKPPDGPHSPSSSTSYYSSTQKPSNKISSRNKSTGSTSPSAKPVVHPKSSSDKVSQTVDSGKARKNGKMPSAVKKSDLHGKVAKSKKEEMTSAKVLSAENPQAQLHTSEVKDEADDEVGHNEEDQEPMKQREADPVEASNGEDMNSARVEESEMTEWDESRDFTGERLDVMERQEKEMVEEKEK